ncbi:MAG: hypothetical protein QM698_12615 [Micropepsaceae bacterium]
MIESSFLIDNPKTYRFWWTFMPALPASKDTQSYRALRRHWADHTMNALTRRNGVLRPGNRGAYVEGREDHLTPALFHIWAALPEAIAAKHLLGCWNIPHGAVSDMRIAYSWEQKRAANLRPDIADIVVSWRDDLGDAVLVIEAKRPGGALKPKDLDGGRLYLEMPSIRPFARKHVAFLLEEHDIARAAGLLPPETRIASWQATGRAQIAGAAEAGLAEPDTHRTQAFIERHYADMGMPLGATHAAALRGEVFDGSEGRYRSVRARMLPESMEAFWLGSEAALCARSGCMPQPPYPWLSDEPSLLDLAALRQTTLERETPHWRLAPRARG